MSVRSRFFPNLLPELMNGEKIEVPEDDIKDALLNIVQNIQKSLKPTEENGRDGLYLGTGGISYMYYHLSKIPLLGEFRMEFLETAVRYIVPAVKSVEFTERACHAGLLLGSAGVYAVAAVVFKATNQQEESKKYQAFYYDAASTCKITNYLHCGSDELFLGRAGYVAGALWMAKETSTDIKAKEIYDICKVIVDSGREYSKSHNSLCPLMYSYYNVEYLGAAHGLCSILQMLLSVPGFLDANPNEAKDIKLSIDFLLTVQDKEGNFPCETSEIVLKQNELIHWCHGAPGVVYVMAKAFLIWGEEKYLKSCEKCADLIWNKGLLRKGPGLCHGIAGNGYVFLLLYRLTNDPKYLHQAVAFAKFMEADQFKKEARVPDNPYSLYEGIAGTACFLGDLLSPDQAAFPFSDVFD